MTVTGNSRATTAPARMMIKAMDMNLTWYHKGTETGKDDCTCSACGKKIARYAVRVEHPLNEETELRLHNNCYIKSITLIHQQHYAKP